MSYTAKAASVLRKNKVPKEKQKEIISKTKEKLKTDKYRNMETGIDLKEDGKINKKDKLEMGIEEVLADEGYENLKNESNEKKKKSNFYGKLDINKTLFEYAKYLGYLNTGMEEIFINWDQMNPDAKEVFTIELNLFIQIINKNKSFFKGEKTWKLLA
jgi:hypothetical protein